MVYLVTGPRGSGKTQQMIDLANEKVKTSNGNVVFIKKSHKDTYTVDFNIRVIRMADYPDVLTLEEFVGFLYGIDCGIKHNIIRKLNEKGCNVTVVPYDITAEEVMAFRPDGLFLSNGPGDPTDMQPVIEMVRTLRGRLPIFGICLGHQVISLAYGARTFKMKFGHRGGNHPVKNLETGKVEITSQNHSFAVDTESLKGTGLTLTHLNLLDDTAEGVECRADRIFSVQYHPESAPGPQDSTYLFDKFIKMMEESQNA